MQYTHNPILVTLTRGAITESVHRGAFALVDDSGNTRLAVGDVLRPIYPRSAVKPLQALPLATSIVVQAPVNPHLAKLGDRGGRVAL